MMIGRTEFGWSRWTNRVTKTTWRDRVLSLEESGFKIIIILLSNLLFLLPIPLVSENTLQYVLNKNINIS